MSRPHLRRIASWSARRLAASLAGVVVLAGVGCSANVVAEPTGTGAQRLAVVDVVLHASAADPDGRLDASARFVSVREPGVADDALDLLGLTYRAVPAGACVAVDVEDGARPVPAVRVDLRDLSPVSIEIRGDEGDSAVLPLEPRAFPDVGGLVSGVVFVAPAAKVTRSTPRGVTVTVSGARLDELELPDAPRVQLPAAVAGDDDTFVDATGFDVLFPPSGVDDRLSVDVLRAGVARARCAPDASGRVRLDAASIGGAGDVVLVARDARRAVHQEPSIGAVDARVAREIELKLTAR